MKLNQDEAKVLREVVAAIPQVADMIAAFPIHDRPKAFETAENGYLRAMRESGFPESAAQRWTAGMMRRLLRQVAERDAANRSKAVYAPDQEPRPSAPQTKPSVEVSPEAERAQDGLLDYLSVQKKAPSTFEKRALASPRGLDGAARANFGALIWRWQAVTLASINNYGHGLWLAASLCLGIAAGLAVSAMEKATFQPYLVGILVFVAVWLLMVSLLDRPKSN